jgi:tyrosyl-tRNA synthetase
VTVDQQIERIRRGTVQVFPEPELRERLTLGRPLRVKLGVDPTAPDLHLGHTVVLEKLRQLQEMGHHATLIIGDYTALVGDPSGRSATRPQLTRDEADRNAETYQTQAFKVLDRTRTEIRRNGEWFADMRLAEVIGLAGQMTVARMLERDDFAGRYKGGNPIGIHEFLYPLMQGWDSVMVRSDIEIGGTDQTFNLLVGRDLQRTAGQPGQIALTLPLLVGLDGVQKMSKSLGNHVGIAEPPEEIYGKLMSISDALMERYALLLLGDDPSWTAQKDAHPLERKKALASIVVARFHGEPAATRARTYFEERFQRRADFAPTPVVVRTGESGVWICKLLKEIGFAASTSAARRLASEGAVRVDGAVVGPEYQFKRGVDQLVSVGRRRIAAVTFAEPTTDDTGD